MSRTELADRDSDSPAGPLLVDCPRRDLLRAALAGPAVELALLDAFVLTRTLGSLLDATWRHRFTSCRPLTLKGVDQATREHDVDLSR